MVSLRLVNTPQDYPIGGKKKRFKKQASGGEGDEDPNVRKYEKITTTSTVRQVSYHTSSGKPAAKAPGVGKKIGPKTVVSKSPGSNHSSGAKSADLFEKW